MSDGGGKISHAHVLARVCKRINACMNLSVHACVCPFLTGPVLHFKICVANDPRLTRSPAERGRVGEGGLSLRARQCRGECLAVCTYVKHARVGVSSVFMQSASATFLIYACAHVQKEPPPGQGRRSAAGGGGRAVVRHECLRYVSGRGGGGGSDESGGK